MNDSSRLLSEGTFASRDCKCSFMVVQRGREEARRTAQCLLQRLVKARMCLIHGSRNDVFGRGNATKRL